MTYFDISFQVQISDMLWMHTLFVHITTVGKKSSRFLANCCKLVLCVSELLDLHRFPVKGFVDEFRHSWTATGEVWM